MGTSSVDIFDFAENEFHVEMPSLKGHSDEVFKAKFDHLNDWLGSRCSGKYMILSEHVVFELEKDALFFQIGYATIEV
jgi:hypothetical protein